MNMSSLWIVFRKELIDALRDRRTLFAILISTLMGAPLFMFVMSKVVSDIEAKAERRVIYAVGMEHSPRLKNFIDRASWKVEAPPADYEQQLRESLFRDPVLVVPKDFDQALSAGERPTLQVISHGANRQANFGIKPVMELVRGYQREVQRLNLALRGVSPRVVEVLAIEQVDLASEKASAGNVVGMVPFFVLMAVLYGAMAAALDTTAGERERGSLEPLLLNPVAPWILASGKWAAVTLLGVTIATATCASFIPAQALVGSEALAASIQFGWREVGWLLLLLVPLSAAMVAVLMAVAIRSKTVKEATANASILALLVSLVPVVAMMQDGVEHAWHLVLPALGQTEMMQRMLRGEDLSLMQVGVPALSCAALSILGVWSVGRALKTQAVR